MIDEEVVVLKPRERHSRTRNSMCKGPEVRMSLTSRRSSEEARVSRAERVRQGREEGTGQVCWVSCVLERILGLWVLP